MKSETTLRGTIDIQHRLFVNECNSVRRNNDSYVTRDEMNGQLLDVWNALNRLKDKIND